MEKQNGNRRFKTVIIYATLLLVFSTFNGFYVLHLQNQHNQQFKSPHQQISDRQTSEEQYAELEKQYAELLVAFNEPLPASTFTPSCRELTEWLREDGTDKLAYNNPNFMCDDFAVMLSQHAKLKKWDVGIVIVFGYTNDRRDYGHAFNVVMTVEGLVYIEPQNDHAWYYASASGSYDAIYCDEWWDIDGTWVYVQGGVILLLH